MWAAIGHNGRLHNSEIQQLTAHLLLASNLHLPTSVRTASLVPADLEMTAKHVFLVLLDLEVTPLDFSSLKAAYRAASRLSPHDLFSTDCCPHQGIAHRSAR
jgi:hypothetical protein